MKRIPAWLTYTIWRLLLVFVPFGVFLAIGMNWLWAIVYATLLGFALSLVLLRKPREATAIALYEAREQRKKPQAQADEEALEDAHADTLREQAQLQQQQRAEARKAEAERAEGNALGNIEGA